MTWVFLGLGRTLFPGRKQPGRLPWDIDLSSINCTQFNSQTKIKMKVISFPCSPNLHWKRKRENLPRIALLFRDVKQFTQTPNNAAIYIKCLYNVSKMVLSIRFLHNIIFWVNTNTELSQFSLLLKRKNTRCSNVGINICMRFKLCKLGFSKPPYSMLQKGLANFTGRITFLLKCLENLNCMENMNNTVLRSDKF